MSKNNAPRHNAKKTTKKAARTKQDVDWATVDRAIRTVAADAFEAGGHAREASELRACAPIDDEDTARAAYLVAIGFADRSLGERADALVGEVVCIAMAAERGDVSRLEKHRAKIESAALPQTFQRTRPRTACDLYKEAVLARLGMTPGERNIDDRPWEMSAGEMLLWSVGGDCLTSSLFEGLLKVSRDLRLLNASDLERPFLGEALEALAVRMDVIAWIHQGAIDHLGRIQLEAGAQ